jgi:hypothetical protein
MSEAKLLKRKNSDLGAEKAACDIKIQVEPRERKKRAYDLFLLQSRAWQEIEATKIRDIRCRHTAANLSRPLLCVAVAAACRMRRGKSDQRS